VIGIVAIIIGLIFYMTGTNIIGGVVLGVGTILIGLGIYYLGYEHNWW